jgi:hypothetical protein
VLCICTCTLYTWGFCHLQQPPRAPGEPGAGAPCCQRGPSQEPLFSCKALVSGAPALLPRGRPGVAPGGLRGAGWVQQGPQGLPSYVYTGGKAVGR